MSRGLDRQVLFIKRVREALGRNFPSQTLETLLAIAQRPGITPTELAHLLGMSVSGAARNVSLLEKSGWPRGTGGHDLLRVMNDPSDWKRKMCYLNTKGERLIEQLLGE
jgi:DNA-binding MarR family transcriptional regulator